MRKFVNAVFTVLARLVPVSRSKYDKLRKDLRESRGETYRVKQELKDLKRKHSEDTEKMQHDIFDLIQDNESLEHVKVKKELLTRYSIIQAIARGDWEKVYDAISGELDSEGFTLYHIAEKFTGVNVCSAFPTEDNMGVFENADGFELLDYLEVEAFGECDWVQMNPPYERAVNMRIHRDTEEYKQYRACIFKKAVTELLGLTELPQKATVNIEGLTTANACAFKEAAEMLAQAFNIDMEAEPEVQPGENQLFVDTFGFSFDEACNDSSEHFMLPQLSERYQQLCHTGQTFFDAWSNTIQETIEKALNPGVRDKQSA